MHKISNLTNRIRHGDIIGVKKAIQGGAPLNCQDKNGNTPLHIAVMENNTDIACLLIQSGATPRTPNRVGKTPADLPTDAAKHVLKHVLDRNLAAKGLDFKNLKI